MKPKINITYGIKNCADCEKNLRCEECAYNEKDFGKFREEIRKETAREILRELYRFLSNFVDEDIGYQDECIETACLYEGLKDIAEKYGVEIAIARDFI